MSKTAIRALFALALLLSPIALIGCGDSSAPSTGTPGAAPPEAPGKPTANATKK